MLNLGGRSHIFLTRFLLKKDKLSVPDPYLAYLLWAGCDRPLLRFWLLNAFHPMSVAFMEPFINLTKSAHRNIVHGGCWLYLICSYCSCRVSAVQHKVSFRLNLLLLKSMRGRTILQVWRHSRIKRGKMLLRERCAEMKLRGIKKEKHFCPYGAITMGKV